MSSVGSIGDSGPFTGRNLPAMSRAKHGVPAWSRRDRHRAGHAKTFALRTRSGTHRTTLAPMRGRTPSGCPSTKSVIADALCTLSLELAATPGDQAEPAEGEGEERQRTRNWCRADVSPLDPQARNVIGP